MHAMTIMQGLDEAGIDKAAMACKPMSSGFDGASVTQGQEGGVRALIRELAPFGLGIWCYAHRLNLASEPLSKQKLVGNLEVLARSTRSCNNHFSHSPARVREWVKAAKEAGTEGHHMLKDVATRWLSQLAPLQRIGDEYTTSAAVMQTMLTIALTSFSPLTPGWG